MRFKSRRESDVVVMVLLGLLAAAMVIGYALFFYRIAFADDTSQYEAIIRNSMCKAMLRAKQSRKWDLWHLSNEQAYAIDGEAVQDFAKRTKTDLATGRKELNKMIDDPKLKPCQRLWGNGPYPDDGKKNICDSCGSAPYNEQEWNDLAQPLPTTKPIKPKQIYNWLPGEYYGGVGENFVDNPDHPTCFISVMKCRKGASKGDVVCESEREEKCVCGVCLSPGYESKYPPMPMAKTSQPLPRYGI
ncbi:MAG: hypothetical protein KGJ90_03910 [Patescibacteria group bacterium]|nr:hypothetical protein [Patescibacteria group bacterium]